MMMVGLRKCGEPVEYKEEGWGGGHQMMGAMLDWRRWSNHGGGDEIQDWFIGGGLVRCLMMFGNLTSQHLEH